MTDGYGAFDTATVTVTVTGADDGSLTVSGAEDGSDGALLSAFLAEGETEMLADAFGGLGQSAMIVADIPLA